MWAKKTFESCREIPAQFTCSHPHSSWITFGAPQGTGKGRREPQNCKYKHTLGYEIQQRLNSLFPVELQAFCWAPAQREQHRTREGCTRGKSSFVGIYWDRVALPLPGTQRMPPFGCWTETNPNTHNTSGQPQCTAPPRWTRRWSNEWGLCPAGRKGFPAPGVELPGWVHFSWCPSFLHRKPWLCNLLLRWDTGRGGKRAKGNVRGSWNRYHNTNPSLLARGARHHSPQNPQVGKLILHNQREEKGKKEMSVIFLVLGTLLQIIPFSSGGSTAFWKVSLLTAKHK